MIRLKCIAHARQSQVALCLDTVKRWHIRPMSQPGAIRAPPIQANGHVGNDRKEMRPGGRPTSQNASFREPGMNLEPVQASPAQKTISTFSQLLVSDKKFWGKFSNMKCHHMSCYAPATKYMDGMCIDTSETSRLPSVFTVKWSDTRTRTTTKFRRLRRAVISRAWMD